jgi:CheY-like chemotaxis protein
MDDMDPTVTLICIDDDPPVLSAIRRLLRHEPYEVLTTVDPRQVLDLVAERRIHVIVADQRMPSMTGTDLLKKVRAVSPETIAIILTGHADLSDIAGAMNDGAVDRLIRKPWDDDGFRGMIRELLSRRKTPAGDSAPEIPSGTLPAAVIKLVDCRSRPDDLLRDLSDFLAARRAPASRVVIVLEDLLQLKGPLTDFLHEIVHRISNSGTRAAIVDGSGTAGAYLELVGGRIPLVAYARTSDISPVKRVLVVEDRPESLAYLSGLIESAGHSCDAVASVDEALRRLAAGRFDLVLLDLVLHDGVEVARYILEKDLKTPVVAVSEERRERSGIWRQVSTPYRTQEILDAIRDSGVALRR